MGVQGLDVDRDGKLVGRPRGGALQQLREEQEAWGASSEKATHAFLENLAVTGARAAGNAGLSHRRPMFIRSRFDSSVMTSVCSSNDDVYACQLMTSLGAYVSSVWSRTTLVFCWTVCEPVLSIGITKDVSKAAWPSIAIAASAQ